MMSIRGVTAIAAGNLRAECEILEKSTLTARVPVLLGMMVFIPP
jgi:hypothetical protein